MGMTIRDVARHAGVSSATVSRVMSSKPQVDQETRRRVLAVVEELGYRPNRVARSLRRERTQIFGLIISDIQNPFFTSLVRAIEDVAYQHGYGVLLCNSDEDKDKEGLYVDLMCGERVAGVVITPTCETNGASRRLIKANIPVVAVDRRCLDEEVDTVVIDNAAAAFEVVSQLISRGHRRIGAVVGPISMTTGHERREGYEKALKAHGLGLVPELLRMGAPKEEFGYLSTMELLDLPDPPTALFLANNKVTMGALRAITKRGLRVPDDIGLASFDLMDWMDVIKTGLIVVAQPTYDLGHTAAELLLERIEGDTRPAREVVLKATVVTQ